MSLATVAAITQLTGAPATMQTFPPMLPYELAMRTGTPAEICTAYGLTREDFVALSQNPLFQKAYNDAVEELKSDGAAFRVKAKMQAEVMIDTAYQMVNDKATADTVRADLLKSVVRWAGYERKPGDTGGDAAAGAGFQININLG